MKQIGNSIRFFAFTFHRMQKKNTYIEHTLNSRILPFVLKPGRYLGNELNAVHKNTDKISVRIALAFPELYEIAMSYIGFDILYHVLNQQEELWAERVYAPWPDMEAKMREHQLPLYSLESFTPLSEFDIIGFTLQYELTYTNILNMLDLGRVALYASERKEEAPFVIAGGPCSCNPEPMAAFMDAFLIGDGEEAFTEISNTIGEGRQAGKTRLEILKELAQIRGVYVPGFYEAKYDEQGHFSILKKTEERAPERILTRILPGLQNTFYPQSPLVPLVEVTHDRLAVEVMRGCTEGCRYCNAGMIYRPTRERAPEDIIDQIDTVLKNTGYEEVSFLSLSISDYSQLNTLMRSSRQNLSGKNINVSFPSMRLDSFTPEIAAFASSVRKSGFTFAPEAGSERLRRVINKNISSEDLFNALHIALENGWKLLKFYFMIGLPTETEEDVEAIADLIDEVVKISNSYGRIRFNISVSPFSPKPHTPFQWEKQDTSEEFLSKISILRQRFSRYRQVKMNWRNPEVSLLECVLGRADRRMAKVIYEAWRNGAKFDGWSEYFKMDIWQRAAQKNNLPFEWFAQELDTESPLPWDHIDKGVSKKFLSNDRNAAFSEQTKADCKQGGCYGCGIQRKQSFAEYANCYRPKKMAQATEPATDWTDIKPEAQKAKPKPIPMRVRMQFQKKNYARYLSQLDLVRLFERASKQAGLPLLYSQGFNPHPKVSFAPPLSLGYTSDAEYLDMEIDAAFDPASISALLNPYLPDGLNITDFKVIREKVTALAAAINSSEYEVDLSDTATSAADFDLALQKILTAEEIQIERRVKGKYKQINIRPFIDSLKRQDHILQIKTRSIEHRTVRIREILQQLFSSRQLETQQLHVHRRRQLIQIEKREMTPLEILK